MYDPGLTHVQQDQNAHEHPVPTQQHNFQILDVLNIQLAMHRRATSLPGPCCNSSRSLSTVITPASWPTTRSALWPELCRHVCNLNCSYLLGPTIASQPRPRWNHVHRTTAPETFFLVHFGIRPNQSARSCDLFVGGSRQELT